MKTKVAVLFGGKTVEHEVSVISAIQAIMSMDEERFEIIPVYITKQNEMYIGEQVGNIDAYKNIPALLSKSTRVVMLKEGEQVILAQYPMKKFGGMKPVAIDVAFPIVHGTNVEDGTLQGFLKTIGIPFVGPDVTASAVGMDKYVQKAILKDNDIPVLDGQYFTLKDYAQMDEMIVSIEKRFGYPVIVKPVNTGSSVGIGVARDRDALVHALDDAYTYAGRVLVEHAITKLREINCAVLGDDEEAIASEIEEPMHSTDILSYEDKYCSGGKGKGGASKGMASVSRQIPANVPAELREKIRAYAVDAFMALGCNGVSRIDFMIDEENGELYFNEINTIPGSLAFYLWEPIGVPYKELLSRMIDLALKRQRKEEALTFTFDTNILNSNGLSGVKGSKR